MTPNMGCTPGFAPGWAPARLSCRGSRGRASPGLDRRSTMRLSDDSPIPRRQASKATLAAAFVAALLVPQGAPAGPFDGLVPAAPTRPPAWAEAFKVFDGTPRPLAWLIENRQHQASTFLVAGARPKDDRPAADHPLVGKPEAGDWVFEDGTAAIRVFGVPAPEPGKAIVLAASFSPADPPSL